MPLPDITLPFTLRQALVAYYDQDTDPTSYDAERYDDSRFSCGHRDFLVLTDDEAETRAKEYAEQWLDELLTNVPDSIKWYFDTDKYLEDNASIDSLASYDGNYEEVYTSNARFQAHLLDCINEVRSLDGKRPLKRFPANRIVFDDGEFFTDAESMYYVIRV